MKNIKNKKFWVAAVILFSGLIFLLFFFNDAQRGRISSVRINKHQKESVGQKQGTINSEGRQEQDYNWGEVEIIAQDLKIPWELAFLPDGSFLATEREGNLVRILPDREIKRIPVAGVVSEGEGGLLGLALHPQFKENGQIYLYLTTKKDGRFLNRVESYFFDLEENRLSEKKEIIGNIPGAIYHNGGRIAFGPDGFLYVATGDAREEKLAQDINSLAGKILRIGANGAMPEDNPFGNLVFSYGHRNVQGIAWDEQGRLWATEHGRSGLLSGLDELNLIEKGKNYGWPEIEGDETGAGMERPVIHSGSSVTWAPSGLVFWQGDLFFTGLRGEALYRYEIKSGKLEKYFEKKFGRLRTAAFDQKGNLFLLTNNTDGRGKPREGDDKIIMIKVQSQPLEN